MRRWHDDDEFWERMAKVIFTPERVDAAVPEVDQIVALLQLAAGARVLDLCCGPGRHSVELARRGFQVTGVDRTRAYLAQAGQRARDAGVRVEWIHSDARSFERPSGFDVAVNLYTSFGYFESSADERAMVENLHRSLRPGGRLLIDLSGKEVLTRTFVPRDWSELPDGSLFLEDRKVRPGWEWTDSRWLLIQGAERFERTISVRSYSAGELRALLESVGFRDVTAFGSLAGAPYDLTAQRLVVTATA